MWIWVRNNARLIMASALALAFGLGAGILIPTGTDKPLSREEKIPEAPAEAASQGQSASILPNTSVQVDYTFAGCGHTVTLHGTYGVLEGKDADGIVAVWPDARVIGIDGNTAHICRERPGYCPAHFILGMTANGELTVSNADEENPATVNVTTLVYDPSGLPEDVQADLRMGIAFDSLEQINAYLEDAES